MIVVLYDTTSGVARSIGSSAPSVTPDGMSVFTLDVPYTEAGSYRWDAESRALVIAPLLPQTRLTVVQFRERFTDAERDRIEMAQTEHPDPLVRARLRRGEKELNSVQGQIADRAYPGLQRLVVWMTTVQMDGTPLIADLTRARDIIGDDAFNPENLA